MDLNQEENYETILSKDGFKRMLYSLHYICLKRNVTHINWDIF